MNLVLFTSRFPGAGSTEQNFLMEEIKYLARTFDTVTLIPRHLSDRTIELPENVVLEKTYAEFLDKPFKPFVIPEIIFSGQLYREIARHLWLLAYPTTLLRLIIFLVGANLTKRWLVKWIREKKTDPKDVIFYTYWFDQSSFGIGMTKRLFPGLKLVSRAHGYDLYPERYSPAYLPLRREALEMVDLIFPDSEMGRKYLAEEYPHFVQKIEFSRLGVPDPGFTTKPSTDGVFRMVSCSLLVPVKRVHLILEALNIAAHTRPHQKFEWRHFGTGDLRAALQARANDELPENARAFLMGYQSNQKLMEFYKDHPIDVFFNVSASEGTPVAVMEAISCGIPIVATAVGGNQEIVNEQNGCLLSADPHPQEIAEAIYDWIDRPEAAFPKRKGSLSIWRRQYHAETNFSAFIQRIQSLSVSS